MVEDGPYVLAVDLGTSGPKAAVVSLEGRIASTGTAHVETIFLPDGGAEQDPESVWDAVKEACGAALGRSPVDRSHVLAVICSSQYSSVIPVDSEGRSTMNMVVWLDQRGSKKRLRQLDGYPRSTDTPPQLVQWVRIHGLPPIESAISLQHMRWIKYARPDVYERTATFLEPMDYVTMRLTGRRTANQCTAFMFLVTDNRSLNVTEYHPKLLEYSLLDSDKLPELLPVDAIVGTVLPDVASELGLSPDTRVVTGLNDTQSGGMGTFAFSGGHAGISVGSTSVVITHVDFKRTDVRRSILSMPSPVPDTYFVMAENGIAGAALEHFLENLIYAKDHFGELRSEERFEMLGRAVAEAPPGSDGVLFLPWMSGTIAPAADSRMRGGFLNLGMKTTRSHMARAVLEGVALNQRWVRGAVERFAKRKISHFLYQGGGAESDAWSQIMADVLGAPVHQTENPRFVPCLGGGLLAFQRLGMLDFDDFERRVPIRRVYEPNEANRAVYDDLFERFVRAFKSVRAIFRTLNRVERDA
jgi:xylulokinase